MLEYGGLRFTKLRGENSARILKYYQKSISAELCCQQRVGEFSSKYSYNSSVSMSDIFEPLSLLKTQT